VISTLSKYERKKAYLIYTIICLKKHLNFKQSHIK